jgi:Rieske 2Fe-2S family protein
MRQFPDLQAIDPAALAGASLARAETIPSAWYTDPRVHAIDSELIFARSWQNVGHAAQVAAEGQYLVGTVADDPVIVVRGRDGELRGFYNVCRHRGSRICDPETRGHAKGAIKCPYHAWSYAYDGNLIGTPLVDPDEVDRSSLSLWPVHVDVWQGYVFVHLGEPAADVRTSFERQNDKPLQYEPWRMDELRTVEQTVTELKANWKILIENYNECLHCPTVHPELVAVAPTFRKGLVFEEGRDDWGVSMEGAGYTATGTTTIPVMPGLTEQQANAMHGASIFPNMFIDLTGTVVIATRMQPRGPEHTTIITDYLFRPEAIADPGFDARETIDFSELVAHQDYVVCERVQQGVRSRFYEHGIYPRQERWIAMFNRRYLQARDAVT